MDRAQLDRWCEQGILGLVLSILVFGPLATGAVRALEFLVLQGMTLGVILLWTARFWLNRSHRLLWPPICWAVLAFVAFAIGRYLTADVEYVARGELIKVLVYAVLFFAVLNNLHRQETAQLVVYVLVFLAMVISSYAVYQFITTSEYVWHFKKPVQYLKRGSGTYICPNHFAGFAEMILPLGVAFTLSGRINSVLKIFLGYASIVILAGIGASISRAGWLCAGLTLGILFYLLVRRHHHYRIPALVALVLVLVGGSLFYMKSSEARRRIAKLSPMEDNVVSESGVRFLLWQSAVEMWKEHPWVGVGPAHFDTRFPAYRSKYLQARPDRAHNDYVNTLADWGVIGLGLVLATLGIYARGTVRCWKFVQHSSNDLSSKPSNRSALVLGCALGLGAIALHSFGDFNLHIPANAVLAVTLLALGSSYMRFASERYWVSVRPPLKLLVTAMALVSLYFLGAQEIRRFREYRALASVASSTSDAASIAGLEKALVVEPKNAETAFRLGETLRLKSWRLEADYQGLANKAIRWFEYAIALNPYDAGSMIRLGMCLHWLDRHAEAGRWFEKAQALDPNGYFTAAHLGWHYVQMGEWARAQKEFLRSLDLKHEDNKIASTYLKIVTERMEAERQSPQ